MLDRGLDPRVGDWLEEQAWSGTGIGGAVRYESIVELKDVAEQAIREHIERVWLGGTSSSVGPADE